MQDDQYLFSPSKFAGYKNNTIEHLKLLKSRDGGETDKLITKLLGKPLEKGDKGYQKIDKQFVKYCQNFDIVPSKYPQSRRYWNIGDQVYPTDFLYPDEIRNPNEIVEGAKVRAFVNRYERSSKARRECVKRYGYACCVCGFDFQERYGILGENYIHVHHIVPLSDIQEGYIVDPIKDLRPVCPNCHSMLHRAEEQLDIDELKKLLR